MSLITSACHTSFDSVVVTVAYHTGATGSAYTRLRAASGSSNGTGQRDFTIVPSAGYAVDVTPEAKPVGVLPNTAASYPFTVRNAGTASNTYTITAICSGSAVASGCTPSSGSVTIPAGGTSTIAVSYTSGGASTTGTITFRAIQANDAGVRDSGRVDLATGTAQAPVARVSEVNPETTVERSMCLAVALAGSAVAECGDLRLAHALPAARTMGRVRAPTLLYSTAHAHPYPLVAAEVRIPAGAANPDSVEAVLWVSGVERARKRWAGSDFSPGRANRITIGFDALNDPTGVYSYTLEVAGLYATSRLAGSPVGSGQLIVVNRSQSEYGAGWWLAGMEQLRLDSMLWIGGDGSARVYRPTGITDTWAAAALHRPDTVKRVGSEYVRLLPSKVEVWFDGQGRHVRTVSRLMEDTTRFHRNTAGRLDSLTLPPATQALRYRFVYESSSGRLDSVIAPPAGTTPRATRLTRSGALVTAIRDPDTTTVSFGYDAGYTNRIVTRTDREGTLARYFFDAVGTVARDSLDPGAGQPVIVTRFRAHESAGFAGSPALDTAVASAAIDGPRDDVGDSTLFWLDRFGAPRRVRDALGAETSVRRENSTFPGLVTRIQEPTGRVMRATYNTRGHVNTVTDSGTVVNGQIAVTRYEWNMTWDALEVLVPPERDSAVIGIDAATGRRIWQQDASGSGSRVNFTYYANGLLETVREPGATLVTTMTYDARGNLREVVSPLGVRDSVYTDNLGRDTLTVTPLDAGQSLWQRARKVYDLRDRVTRTETSAPAMPYTLNGVTPDPEPVPAEEVVVEHEYDREGRLRFVTTSTSPAVGVGMSDEVMTYDRAGRLLSKKLGAGPTNFTYDAAGNAVTQTFRGGVTVTAQYDALNRVVERIVPRRAYPRTDCTGHAAGPISGTGPECLIKAPYFPNLVGDSLKIPADTLEFAYDLAGNLVRADNRYAHVRRTYQVNGLLETDTLHLRNYANEGFTAHVYQLRYGYDRNGRRAWMTLEGQAGTDSLTYAYSPAHGALTQVTDGAGRRYALTYTPAGRLDSLKVFASGAGSPGIREGRRYDADGRLVRRERRTGGGALLQLDSLVYDARGKATEAVTSSAAESQMNLTAGVAYAGLGAVVASQVTRGITWNLEEFRDDGLGRVWYQRDRYAEDPERPSAQSFYSANGLLRARSGARPPSCSAGTPFLDTLYQIADPGGNVIRSGERTVGCGEADKQIATNFYYRGDNRLAVMQRRSYATPSTWEEYWYDALGRRVLTRAEHDIPVCDHLIGCEPFVERVVWDGDQVLAEQRSATPDGAGGSPPNYGTVGYVHLLGIDRPVALQDGRVIHYNWRGLAEASSWADGTPADCELDASGSCTRVAWPAGKGVYYKTPVNSETPSEPPTWIGSLPANGEGAGGLLYRRNRYYDPSTGQFTQEDPIGLAGGLNLYGFAGGDPVNFSDPFGLTPCGPFTLWCARAAVFVLGRALPWLTRVGAALSGVSAGAGQPASNPRAAATLARLSGVFRGNIDKLDDVHLSAAAREAAGEVVAWHAARGRPYDHMTEVQNAVQGMRNVIAGANRLLSRGRPTDEQREAAELLRQQAMEALRRAQEVLGSVNRGQQ